MNQKTDSSRQLCALWAGALCAADPQQEATQLLRRAGAELADSGLRWAEADSLAPLAEMPPVALLRWWGFLRLSDSYLPRLAASFGWDEVFVLRLNRLEAWFRAGCPENRTALKRRLQCELPLPPEQVFAAFAALSPAFAALPAEYEALKQSGEPFRAEQLAITPAELLAEGVPLGRLAEIQSGLLAAVVEAPALNVWPVLAGMAKGLCKTL